jgi:hypothetical protein
LRTQTATAVCARMSGNMNMEIINPHSESAALEASRRTLLPTGWIDGATIRDAVERPSARGNEMTELTIAVPDGRGGERLFKDYLTNAPLAALRVRHISEAVGALEHYNSGEIEPQYFVGHTVRVKVGVEKRRGYPPRNIIVDYAPPTGNSLENGNV